MNGQSVFEQTKPLSNRLLDLWTHRVEFVPPLAQSHLHSRYMSSSMPSLIVLRPKVKGTSTTVQRLRWFLCRTSEALRRGSCWISVTEIVLRTIYQAFVSAFLSQQLLNHFHLAAVFLQSYLLRLFHGAHAAYVSDRTCGTYCAFLGTGRLLLPTVSL